MSDTSAPRLKPPKNPAAEGELPGGDASSGTAARIPSDSATLSHQGDGSETPPAGSPLEDAVEDRTIISPRPPSARGEASITNSTELGRMLVGQRLGHFNLDEFVGGGGMGAVFRGTDVMLGRTVAVKVLSRQHAEDEEATRRFRNEAQSAARLDHENIARVYYVGVDRGWHYIVLEYIEGQNVRDLIQEKGPLALADVLEHTLQIAEALSHASSRDVVHRDIKPSNVLVTRTGRVKLVDMGLARLHQVEQSSGDITASGVTLGTFDYISPEQARDPRAADVRSDLYSLGCTMYFMLCGRPPFPEGTVLQKLLQHQGDEAPDLRQFRDDLPDELVAIVQKLLRKNPEQRYQDPAELTGELLLLAEQLGFTSPRGRPAVWIAPRAAETTWIERHVPWLVPLALLVLVALAVQLTGGGTPNPAPLPPQPRAVEAGPGGTQDAPVAAPTNADVPHRAATAPTGAVVDPKHDAARDAAKNSAATDAAPLKSADAPASESGNNDSLGGNPRRGADTTDNRTPRKKTTPSPPVNGAPPPDRPTTAAAGGAQILLVGDGADGRRGFRTLADACREAPSGAVIELRFNGRRDERPILLSNRELTVRAGEGFHPIVRFRPDGADPLLFPRSMITVAGGDLTLVNVALELEIPQVVHADRWTLIETVLADTVRLERSTLTIYNANEEGDAYHEDVHFFFAKSPPRRETGMKAEALPEPRTSIELRDCVVRGEATLLAGNALHTLSLQWENGLLATSRYLMEAVGGNVALASGGQLQIDLQHVTALMRAGMCLLTSRDDDRYLPPLRIDCTDCILMTGDAPLLIQHGDESEEDQQKQISFKGNHNCYEGINVFWEINGPQTNAPTKMDWAAWREYWGRGRESTKRHGAVIFQRLPDRRRLVSSHTPTDYALDESAENNAARAAATDGTTDVGMMRDRLPTLKPTATPPADRLPRATKTEPAERPGGDGGIEPRAEEPPPEPMPEPSPSDD